VKCDENKPLCLRCLKFGIKCDGYLPPCPRKTPTAKDALKIRPYLAPKVKQKLSSRNQSQESPLPLSKPPASDLQFRNDSEQRYFHVFKNDLIPEISFLFKTSIWNRTILSACHSEPFVKDAVLAISALSISIKDPASSFSKTHYAFALERYDNAVRKMRSSLTSEECHLRKALIGCLLVFCFEGFQGFTKQALLHVIAGYNLLHKWLVAHSFRLVRRNGNSLKPSVVEDELLDTFARLHMHAVSITGDPGMKERTNMEMIDGDGAMADMPSVFGDLDEANRYWIFIMRRCTNFMQEARACAHPLSPPRQDGYETSRMEFGSSIHTPFPTGYVDSSILAEYEKLRDEIVRWQAAFDPLFSAPDSRCLFLQIASLSVQLLVEAVIVTSECAFDAYSDQYLEIVSLSKLFFEKSPQPNEESLQQMIPFSLEVTILPSLYVICKFCRDGKVRREAIELMGKTPKREGVWDSMLMARISTWLVRVEEEGEVDGYIPENRRARMTRVEVDVVEKHAYVTCEKRTGEGAGVVILEKTIKLD
jgi:hypothetical protein